jgi:hypothetical protein
MYIHTNGHKTFDSAALTLEVLGVMYYHITFDCVHVRTCTCTRALTSSAHMHMHKGLDLTIRYGHLDMREVLGLGHLAANHVLGDGRGGTPFLFRNILRPISVYAAYVTRSDPFDALCVHVTSAQVYVKIREMCMRRIEPSILSIKSWHFRSCG